MAPRKQSTLDRILGRLDDLDSANLAALVQRLARERRLLETVFNSIQDGVLVIDTAGIIQFANTAGAHLIGLRTSEIGKAVLWKMVPDLARSLDSAIIDETEPEESQVISREIELTYPDRRFVRLLMVPVLESVGADDQRGFAVILSDISEEKASTEELIENEKIASIMNLAAGVAHELGNPLNSLTIHLQLMERRLAALEEKGAPEAETKRLRKSLGICSSEVTRLDGIIENFLDAVRPREADMAELQIFDVLQQVLDLQEEELGNLGLEVDVEVPSEVPKILGDRQQIHQVLFNVLKNGMEATERGGHIVIRASHDDTYVFLQFRDTGVGIEADDLAKVFNPYFTTKSSGHGLGMMIVQRIMREHGAKIGIDSRPGVGTVVTLQFLRKGPRTRLLK
ncbi:MAG: two-component system sensor histidine kinase NtrB [Opitutales bacterium]